MAAVLTGICLLVLEGRRLARLATLARLVVVTAPAACFVVASFFAFAGVQNPPTLPIPMFDGILPTLFFFVQEQAALSYWELLFRGPLVLVFGAEGRGVKLRRPSTKA